MTTQKISAYPISMVLPHSVSKIYFPWLEVFLYCALAGMTLIPILSLAQDFSRLNTKAVPETVVQVEEDVPMLPEYVVTAPRVKR